jgi:hypothetical protein
MSDFGIKVVIILVAIAAGIASRYIPSQKDRLQVQNVAEEVVKDEVMGL